MSIIQRLIDKLRGKPSRIIIPTDNGPVSETIRRQAAINMRLDPVLRAKVEALITKQLGGDVEAGKAEFARRYPEALQ